MNNIEQLQKSYENRIKDFRGFIYKQTRDNDDLRQEACLAMWRGLLKDPDATDGFLMNRIRWRMREVWKSSSSVNKPHKKRDDITILRFYPQDFENEIFVEFFENNKQPLDEQVIAKIDTERFFHSLDDMEQKIVLYKLEGRRDSDIVREQKMPFKRYQRVKRGIRPKIKEFFAV
jgi:DNA-directed RNA polymerase specialized sigma24 family protein